MSLTQLAGAYITFPFAPAVNEPATDNPTYITEPTFDAFKRLWVNYIFKQGTTYVYWELERGFADPGPYTFTLQGSHSGTPRGDDWFDISTTSLFFATDTGGSRRQRMFGKSLTLYYRVLLVTPLGKYFSPVISADELFNKHDWLIVREIQRQEQLAHSIFSSEKGYLLKGRRYGRLCEKCRDRSVNGTWPGTVTNTNCTDCYGTGFISGYYPPTEFYALIQPNTTRERREIDTVGTTKDDVVRARFLGSLPLIQGDVWISEGNDYRYYIHSIQELAIWKSVPIVLNAELRLAPFTDAVYDIPIGV
jgi:hypothetical protein